MGRLVMIFCDRCGLRGPSSQSNANEARRSAKDLGWWQKGGDDLCPHCVKEAGPHIDPGRKARCRAVWHDLHAEPSYHRLVLGD